MRFKYLASLSALAIAVLSTNSYAVEIVPSESVLAAPDAAAFDWSGLYAGVNAGGGFGEFKDLYDITIPTVESDGSIDLSTGGFVGGVEAGYNWQLGQLVYGIEADFQGSGVKGEGSLVGGIAPGSLSGDSWTKIDWLSTVRARIGFTPVDRLMVYATGGLAYGSAESMLVGNVGPVPIAGKKSERMAGWTVGGGVEYALTNNWTVKSEYLYTDLGTTTLYNADIVSTGSNSSFRNDVTFHTVRVGLNYKF